MIHMNMDLNRSKYTNKQNYKQSKISLLFLQMALSNLLKSCLSEIILSDGGLASELERDHQDLNSDLWSGEVFIRCSSIKLLSLYCRS